MLFWSTVAVSHQCSGWGRHPCQAEDRHHISPPRPLTTCHYTRNSARRYGFLVIRRFKSMARTQPTHWTLSACRQLYSSKGSSAYLHLYVSCKFSLLWEFPTPQTLWTAEISAYPHMQICVSFWDNYIQLVFLHRELKRRCLSWGGRSHTVISIGFWGYENRGLITNQAIPLKCSCSRWSNKVRPTDDWRVAQSLSPAFPLQEDRGMISY